MQLLKTRQSSAKRLHGLTEAQYLRQCLKALCDNVDSATGIILEENAGDPYLNPENVRIRETCRALQALADGARVNCLDEKTRVWPNRIIGGR
jgi:hypothetical protein